MLIIRKPSLRARSQKARNLPFGLWKLWRASSTQITGPLPGKKAGWATSGMNPVAPGCWTFPGPGLRTLSRTTCAGRVRTPARLPSPAMLPGAAGLGTLFSPRTGLAPWHPGQIPARIPGSRIAIRNSPPGWKWRDVCHSPLVFPQSGGLVHGHRRKQVTGPGSRSPGPCPGTHRPLGARAPVPHAPRRSRPTRPPGFGPENPGRRSPPWRRAPGRELR